MLIWLTYITTKINSPFHMTLLIHLNYQMASFGNKLPLSGMEIGRYVMVYVPLILSLGY
jgi:hypothetical protein